MNPDNALRPCIALDGVHGVHLVSTHAPFAFQEINHHGDYNSSARNTGSRQHLIVK